MNQAPFDTAFTITVQGTEGGTTGDWALAIDRAARILRVLDATNEDDIRVVGNEFSINGDFAPTYGRNYAPMGELDRHMSVLETRMRAMAPIAASQLDFDDYTAKCTQRGATPVIQFSYAMGGTSRVEVIERAPPHRPLSSVVVDPPQMDDYRATVTYVKPSVLVETSLHRAPLSIELKNWTTRSNDRGGITESATIGPNSQWAPLEEFHSRLMPNANEILAARVLQAGTWRIDEDNVFDYADNDANQLISAGDSFSYSLASDVYFKLFDDWANQSTNMHLSE